jgi:hypothetical protein
MIRSPEARDALGRLLQFLHCVTYRVTVSDVIKSFRHRGIERFFRTGSRAGIQPKHEARLRILLTTLNLASTPLDMNRAGWDWHPLRAI